MEMVYLLIGGNIGDRVDYINKTSLLLKKYVGQIVKRSALYETDAWGFDSAPFLNQVLVVETKLQPEEVLREAHAVEEKMGRKRFSDDSYHPRTMDVDILFYANKIISLPHLTIPHPRIAQRRFVLEPLNEIAASLIHPVTCKSVTKMLDECIDKGCVRRYTEI